MPAKMSGHVEMKHKLNNVKRNAMPRSGAALFFEMGIEQAEVIRRTPRDSGDLRSTVRRVGPEVTADGRSVAVWIVAGGPVAPYALIVHEDLEAYHAVGQAKYLESVIKESRSFIGARVARRIDIAKWTE